MDNNTEVVYLYLDDIIPNRFQPREVFDEQGLKELAVSIKEHGVIQPIIVRKVDNKYEIIAGERRYKASTMAGLTKIPAIVKNLDDKESSKVALIENLQRRDLTPIEEARTYQKILELEDGMTQEELAASVGKTQSSVSNKLRLLALPEEVQDALLNEKISERHARCLLNIENENDQVKMLNRVIEEKLTVRELDKIIKGEDKKEEKVEEPTPAPEPEPVDETPSGEEGGGTGLSIGISSGEEEPEPEVVEEQPVEEPVVEEAVEEPVQESEVVETLEETPAPAEPAPAETMIRDMTEPEPATEAPQEATPAGTTFDISTIQNPFARKEVDEPVNNDVIATPAAPVAATNIVPNPMAAPVPPIPVAPAAPAPAAPVQAAIAQPAAVAPATGATDNKSITDTISKIVEDYKAKGANIDFRSYNIGTVTSISITIR